VFIVILNRTNLVKLDLTDNFAKYYLCYCHTANDNDKIY